MDSIYILTAIFIRTVIFSDKIYVLTVIFILTVTFTVKIFILTAISMRLTALQQTELSKLPEISRETAFTEII